MKNTVALITGGAGNVGSATAAKLAVNKTSIVIIDKNQEAGLALIAKLKSEYQIEASYLDYDLGEKDSFHKIKDDIAATYGKLDFIVNNAAFYDDVPGWGVPFEQEGYEAWEKVMKVNLLAPFFLIQSLVPLLNKSDCASIVNIGSIYGMSAPNHALYEGTDMTNPAAYAASKGGLTQLSKWLSTVLAPNIRVNTVTPGGIERGQDQGFIKRYEKLTPLNRMASNEDIAGAITFLLSKDAGYITGQNIVVDGGWTAW